MYDDLTVEAGFLDVLMLNGLIKSFSLLTSIFMRVLYFTWFRDFLSDTLRMFMLFSMSFVGYLIFLVYLEIDPELDIYSV